MLNTKEIQLLYYLIEQDTAQSINIIAEHFTIGERSIRYYISNINTYFSKPFIMVTKGNCWIEEKEHVKKLLSDENIVLYSSELQKMIIRYFIVFYEGINLTAISDTLQISRSSTKAYFEEVKNHFSSKFTFDLEHKKGIILQYDEVELRKLQLQTLVEFNNLDTYKQQSLLPYLNQYYDEKNSKIIDIFLSAVQQDMKSILSDQAHMIVKLYILIIIRRIHLGHETVHNTAFDFLYECKEYNILRNHLPILETNFSISFSNDELLALCDLFIGSHYSEDDNLKENNWFEYELFVSKIINMFGEIYKINLHQDYLLYQSLLTHLKPTLYRLQNNIKVQEIDSNAIYTQFTKEYETTRIVLNRLQFFTNVAVDSSEIALLTLHFKAAIDRYQNRFTKQSNILIVCSHGYGTSQLLKQQLLDAYEVHVIDCIPAHFLNSFKELNQVDLIITTIPDLEAKSNIPIIQVAPVLNDKDYEKLSPLLFPKQKNRIFLSKLMEVLQENCFIKDEEILETTLLTTFPNQLINDIDRRKSSLLHILPLQNIAFKPDIDNWQDAVRLGGSLLEKNNYCTKQYTENLLSSFENYGDYMIIADGVAIPHARTDDSVKQTGMSLIILDKPVLFHKDKKLSIFFSFCSKDNSEHIDALVSIANLIKESEFRDVVYNFDSALDVLRYIYEFVA